LEAVGFLGTNLHLHLAQEPVCLGRQARVHRPVCLEVARIQEVASLGLQPQAVLVDWVQEAHRLEQNMQIGQKQINRRKTRKAG